MSKMLAEAMGEEKPFDFNDLSTKADLQKRVHHKK
jgi:hypothetical protein